jgi:hypothetical protein
MKKKHIYLKRKENKTKQGTRVQWQVNGILCIYKQISKFLKIYSTDENDITYITGTLPGLEMTDGFDPRVKLSVESRLYFYRTHVS